MRKIKFIFGLFMFSLLFVLPQTVKAQNLKSWDLVSVSDDSYKIKYSIRNYSTLDLNSITYPNLSLKSFTVIGHVVRNNRITSGTFAWENPEYVIKPEEQTVNLLFTDNNTTKTIVFKVFIDGLNVPLKKIFSTNTDPYSEITYSLRIGDDIKEALPIFTFASDGVKSVKGTTIIGDSTQLSLGYHEIPWSFTPDDSSYEIKTGVIKVNVIPLRKETEESPTLTANSIILDTNSTYDINVDNKVSNSSYLWTSSDTKVAKVNSKGIVSTINKGSAKISCKVTTPTDTYTLSSNVIVGVDDDNYSQLNENDLDLEIGELFDINVENKIAKSTYKWKSADKSVARVTSTSGKVTAIGKGETVIYCTIKTPDNDVIVLKCNVSVLK